MLKVYASGAGVVGYPPRYPRILYTVVPRLHTGRYVYRTSLCNIGTQGDLYQMFSWHQQRQVSDLLFILYQKRRQVSGISGNIRVNVSGAYMAPKGDKYRCTLQYLSYTWLQKRRGGERAGPGQPEAPYTGSSSSPCPPWQSPPNKSFIALFLASRNSCLPWQ
jgi:hypothetical protein